MVTIIQQANRKLTVFHGSHLEVKSHGHTAIVVSYKDHCINCDPVLFDIEDGDVDLTIEIHSPSDGNSLK